MEEKEIDFIKETKWDCYARYGWKEPIHCWYSNEQTENLYFNLEEIADKILCEKDAKELIKIAAIKGLEVEFIMAEHPEIVGEGIFANRANTLNAIEASRMLRENSDLYNETLYDRLKSWINRMADEANERRNKYGKKTVAATSLPTLEAEQTLGDILTQMAETKVKAILGGFAEELKNAIEALEKLKKIEQLLQEPEEK